MRVLTGDNQDVAVSICRRLGIDTVHTLTGEELEQLTDNDIPMKVERTTVFSELSPRQKVQVVQILRTNGHTVGFLGDGMNDLPAIVESDVGISVDTASEAVKEGADVVLLKKDLNVLEEGIKEGRKAFANVSKYIKITASSNFGNILSIVIASVFLPFFPMTSLQLLLLNLRFGVAHDVAQLIDFLADAEGKCLACLACTPRTPNAVYIILTVMRYVEIAHPAVHHS